MTYSSSSTAEPRRQGLPLASCMSIAHKRDISQVTADESIYLSNPRISVASHLAASIRDSRLSVKEKSCLMNFFLQNLGPFVLGEVATGSRTIETGSTAPGSGPGNSQAADLSNCQGLLKELLCQAAGLVGQRAAPVPLFG